MRGRASTLQVTVKCSLFQCQSDTDTSYSPVKEPSLEKKQGLAESQGSFQSSGRGIKGEREKKVIPRCLSQAVLQFCTCTN